MTDVLYSARHWSDEAKGYAQQAYQAVGQVGNGIIPVICCKSSAPTAETLYKVHRTTFSYITGRDYGYVRTSGTSGSSVADNTAVYSDKRGLYQSDTVSSRSAYEYTGDTQSNTLSNGDMYYNTTDNKIYTYNSSTSTWGSEFTVTDTILVLDRNTNKLMHLIDGTLEGVYTL